MTRLIKTPPETAKQTKERGVGEGARSKGGVSTHTGSCPNRVGCKCVGGWVSVSRPPPLDLGLSLCQSPAHLWQLNVANLSHLLLALLLLLQQLLLAGNVAAITLCRHILAKRLDCLPGNHTPLHPSLDGDIIQLPAHQQGDPRLMQHRWGGYRGSWALITNGGAGGAGGAGAVQLLHPKGTATRKASEPKHRTLEWFP